MRRGRHNIFFSLCLAGAASLMLSQENIDTHITMPSCIYCGDPATAREHWLPRGLGTFGGQQFLRDTICEDCNQVLGREVDQPLLHIGPEAIHRQALGIEGRRGTATDSFYRNASTTQPVQALSIGDDDDHSDLFWEPVTGDDGVPQGRLMQQVVFEDSRGDRRAVLLNLAWSPEVLRNAMRAKGVEGWIPTEVYVDDEDLPRTLELLRAVVGQGHRIEHYRRSGAGETVRTLGFTNTVDASYFRGLAKVGLHCALRLVPGLDGHAWEFDLLRRFIRHGELPAYNPVSRRSSNLVADLSVAMPTRRGHLFVIDGQGAHLFVTIQLFAASTLPFTPPAWRIRLGRKPEGLQPDVWGPFVASYFDEPDPSGHDGCITRVDRRQADALDRE